jgi:hypothetical protein
MIMVYILNATRRPTCQYIRSRPLERDAPGTAHGVSTYVVELPLLMDGIELEVRMPRSSVYAVVLADSEFQR